MPVTLLLVAGLSWIMPAGEHSRYQLWNGWINVATDACSARSHANGVHVKHRLDAVEDMMKAYQLMPYDHPDKGWMSAQIDREFKIIKRLCAQQQIELVVFPTAIKWAHALNKALCR